MTVNCNYRECSISSIFMQNRFYTKNHYTVDSAFHHSYKTEHRNVDLATENKFEYNSIKDKFDNFCIDLINDACFVMSLFYL